MVGIVGEAAHAARPNVQVTNINRMIQRLFVSMSPVYNACPLRFDAYPPIIR